VLATVVSRHGPRVILDAGRKAVGADLMMPVAVGQEAVTAFLDEEHAGLDVGEDCELAVGDTVELMPGYGPTAVNLHPIYHVVENGIVTAVWPVLGRHGSDAPIGKERARD
jgi:D-serine deaminase-like pyridoxal phosphate-dependent protein